MKLKITKIIKDNLVEFSGHVGVGVGLWADLSDREGAVRDIEFDIDPIIRLGHNAQFAVDTQCFIRHQGDINEVQGLIEQIDEDGVAFFRLAVDCLFLIELDRTGLNDGDYILITVKADELKVTPWGIPI